MAAIAKQAAGGPRGILSALAGGVVLTYGLALAFVAWPLLSHHGTPYYLACAAATALAAALVMCRQRSGLAVYAVAFAGSVAWAVWEAGPHLWLFLPRLGAPAVVGIVLALPWLREPKIRRTLGIITLTSAVALLATGAAGSDADSQSGEIESIRMRGPAAATADPGEWRTYGNTPAGTRFSAASQITPQNVGRLQPIWRYATGEDPTKTPDPRNLPAFEATPLKIGTALYFCTPRNQVIAIDAETGVERWRFDPASEIKGNFYLVTCRGVAYHEAGSSASHCARRIVAATLDARLFALDAQTGKPCRDFGNDGIVSLRDHIGTIEPGFYGVTSAPTITGDVVIVGSIVLDNQSTDVPSGVVRAFDVHSGKLRWAWDSGRPSTVPLTDAETYTRGSPNAWAPFSVDERLGLVYLPTGNASPDYFGGMRSAEAEKYASSIVALDLATGQVRWAFQTVHHDLWDYDVASQPTLVDLPREGSSVPALIQTTKRGDLFVLDRRDGKPLEPVEERPAPGGPADGDRVSPTQPHSIALPSLTPKPLREASMWGVTPFDQVWCRLRFLESRYEGQFTPPSVQGSIEYPNNMGVSNWGGVSVDLQRKILIANTAAVPSIVRLVPRAEAQRQAAAGKIVYNPQKGTPYAVEALPFLSPLGIPCNEPPWGVLTAIDLVTKKKLWQQPFGTTRDRLPLSIAVPLGLPNIGGSLVTATGLTFIGASADSTLRAFDTASGKLLWQAKLPAGAQATPMTYINDAGKQFVVVAAGGHTYLGTKRGDAVVAFALP